MGLNSGQYALRRTYTIRQLSNAFGVTSRTLRFYEERGLVTPERYGASRIYSEEQRHRLFLIVSGRRMGLTIAEITEIFDRYDTLGKAAQDEKALELFEKRMAALVKERETLDAQLVALREASGRLRERMAADAAEPQDRAA